MLSSLAPALSVLTNRDFRLLASGQLLSGLGDGVALIAVSFAVLQSTGSLSALGLVLGVRHVCLGLFLLLGGVVGDRLSRRRILVASDLTRALAQGLLAVLLLLDRAHLWQCLVLQAVYGAAEAFFRPALTGLVPQVVPRAGLRPANALSEITFDMSRVMGPVIGGLLVMTSGAGGAVALDASTFALSAVFVCRMKGGGELESAATLAPLDRRSVLLDLREGWFEITRRPWLCSSTVSFAVYGALTVPAVLVLGPAASWRGLGGVAGWSALTSAFGVGAMTGSVVAMNLEVRRPGVMMMLMMMVAALRPATFVSGWPLPAIAAYSFLSGAAFAVTSVICATLLQTHLRARVLSRVDSIGDSVNSLLIPAGYVLAAPFAATAGLGMALILLAAIPAVVCALVLLVPGLRSLGWTSGDEAVLA